MHWQLINKSESRLNSFSMEFIENSKDTFDSVFYFVLCEINRIFRTGHLKEAWHFIYSGVILVDKVLCFVYVIYVFVVNEFFPTLWEMSQLDCYVE